MVLACSANAGEIRYYGYDPTGQLMRTPVLTPIHPEPSSGQIYTGALTTAKLGPIRSVQPYAYSEGEYQERPEIVDDLMYESLFLEDPSLKSERMFPLVASGVRVAEDLSYVIFEIDPRARFNDGLPIQGFDIYFSFMLYKRSHPDVAKYLSSVVSDIMTSSKDIRFGLTVRGQQARDAILQLARIKVVKLNTTGNQSMGGIPVRHTGSGPYQLTQLSPYRITLVRNQFYWGNSLPSRIGFFNFREVGTAAFATVDLAASSLSVGSANFYHEERQGSVREIADRLHKSSSPISLNVDTTQIPGAPKRSYAFNLDSPQMEDFRMRQALLLAYDFSLINSLYNNGDLVRPLSLLDGSSYAPRGLPFDSVKALLRSCPLPPHAEEPFENYGVSLFNKLGDKRTRLLAVGRLIQEAGYRLVNGRYVKRQRDGTDAPLIIKIAVYNQNDQTRFTFFKNEIAKLGIEAQLIVAPTYTDFEKIIASNDYDIAPVDERLLSRDLIPRADLARNLFDSSFADPLKPGLMNVNRLRLPCVDGLLQTMSYSEAGSGSHKDASEAIARIQQILYLNIPAGDPVRRYYFFDQRIKMPANYPLSRAPMAGRWALDVGQ